MANQPKLDEIVAAVQSLKIVPDVIKYFIEMLQQCYFRLKSEDLRWICILCFRYYDNYFNYVEFIRQVIAKQFLDEGYSQGNELGKVKTLQGDINAATKEEGRLDRLLGETIGQEQVLENVRAIRETLENIKDSEAKWENNYQMFSEWSKGIVLQPVDLAKKSVVNIFWDDIYKNIILATKSDYDHDKLVKAVENIEKTLPVMKSCIEKNRSALKALGDVFNKDLMENEEMLKKIMQSMYRNKDDIRNKVEEACDEMIKNINSS